MVDNGVPEEARTDEIPDEAIEAAARADYEWTTHGEPWSECDWQDDYRRCARQMLAAAAPILTAAARASGTAEGAAAERERLLRVAEIEHRGEAHSNAWHLRQGASRLDRGFAVGGGNHTRATARVARYIADLYDVAPSGALAVHDQEVAERARQDEREKWANVRRHLLALHQACDNGHCSCGALRYPCSTARAVLDQGATE